MARKPNTEVTEPSTQEITMSQTQTTTFEPISINDGAYVLDWTGPNAIPEVSKYRAAKSGFAHMLQNEVASQVVSRIRKELGHAKDNQVTKEQVQAFRSAQTDKVATWESEYVAAKIQAIRDGTIADRAVSTREPARSPLDKLALAKMGVALDLAIKAASAKRVAAGGVEYKPSAKDLAERVRNMANDSAQMAKYRALAQAELDAMGGGDFEVDLDAAA